MEYSSNNDIRYGETGNAVFKKCYEFFGGLYQYTKYQKEEKIKYDYFLAIYRM